MTERPSAKVSWPGRFDWLAAFTVALLVFALEAYVATAIGRTHSLAYDGLGYAAHARVQYFQLGNLLHHPVQYLSGFFSFIAGLWSAFLVLTFAIVGVGEGQSFFAWFWYLFFLLLLVVWIARVTGGRKIAVLLAICTALLPLCSPMLSLAIHYQLGLDWQDVMEANLADGRPDPLAHVFMLWSVVPLLLHGRQAHAKTFVFTAVAAAASVLTKGTTAPLTVGCWGLAMLYVAWLQRDRRRQVLKWAAWGGLTFSVLLLPWTMAGGLSSVLNYIRDAYAWQPFYKQGGDVSKFIHFPFWHYFLMIEYYFTWPVVALMTAMTLLGTIRILRGNDRSTQVLLVGLVLVAAGILLPLYLQTLRNHAIGMPLYLTLWLIVVVSAAFVWRLKVNSRRLRLSLAGVLATCFSAIAMTALLGAWNWPQDDLRRLLEGRQLIQQVAADIKAQLTVRDTFGGLVLTSGWPLILQFHMTTDATGYPASFRFWPPDGPAIATQPEARKKFIGELEAQAKLIVTFKEPPEMVYRQARMSEFWLPHFNALYEYLNGNQSRYRPVKEYAFPEPGRLFFPPAAGTVVMYLRDDVPNQF